MSDITANQIVFFILIFIIIGLLMVLKIFLDVKMGERFVGRLRNNSGNYSPMNILLMAVAIGAIYFIIIYIFRSKTTVRPSLTRSQDDSSE